MSFVSTAVMTGFTTGIALQIVTGVIEDATAYDPDAHNTIAKLVDAIAHIADWDGTTVLVTAATVAVWAVFRAIRPLESYATLIALLVVSLACLLLDPDVEWVGDIASIPARFRPCPRRTSGRCRSWCSGDRDRAGRARAGGRDRRRGG